MFTIYRSEEYVGEVQLPLLVDFVYNGQSIDDVIHLSGGTEYTIGELTDLCKAQAQTIKDAFNQTWLFVDDNKIVYEYAITMAYDLPISYDLVHKMIDMFGGMHYRDRRELERKIDALESSADND